MFNFISIKIPLLLLVLNLNLFITAVLILKIIKDNNLPNLVYKIILILMLWLIILLPLTYVFLIKFNVIINNLFEYTYIIILLIATNTGILIIYKKYYINIISAGIKKIKNNKINQYSNLWVYISWLVYNYTYIYVLII